MNKTLLLLPCLLYFSFRANSQVPGCTDPAANNFNAGATQNNGSCTYNNLTLTPTIEFTLPSSIHESSGLLWWNGKVWTHNDSGDGAFLYEVDSLTGTITRTITVTNAANADWEDIAQDDNFIYIGDFGNNANGNRTDLKIYKVAKNDIIAGDQVTATQIQFAYEDQTNFSATGPNNTSFDCEAMIVYNNKIFLFTKDWVNKQTALYELPVTPGIYTAAKKATLNVQGLITGADIVADRRTIVLCGYSTSLAPFLYLLYDFTNNDFFDANKRKVELAAPFTQTEGITWVKPDYLFLGNEQNFLVPARLESVSLKQLLDPYYIILPIHYIKLHTRKEGSDVWLSWEIRPQEDISAIEVQRMDPGTNSFHTIARVSTDQLRYQDLHVLDHLIKISYRLKVTDKDEEIYYSPVQTVKGNLSAQIKVKVQSGALHITLPGQGGGSVQILGSDGTMLLAFALSGETTRVGLSGLPAGYYIGRVLYRGESNHFPFILTR